MMNTMNVAPVLPSVSEIVASAYRVLRHPDLSQHDRWLVEDCLEVMPNGYAAEALASLARVYQV